MHFQSIFGALVVACTSILSVDAEPTLAQMMSFLKQYNTDWSFPRVVDIANTVNYSALDPNVVGRVDITNTFVGAELNTEYLFGMFSAFGSDTHTSLIGVPLNQTISQLVVQGNTVFTSLIVTFNWTVEIIPVQFNVAFMFNDEGKVIEYDAVLVRSNWILPLVLPKMVPLLAQELGLPASTDPTLLATTRAAIDICAAHEQYCVGDLVQYNSTDTCMDFIMKQVPFGDIWQAGQNTGICRYLHAAMVPRRPTVHCAHIGPTGGDMCTEKSYFDVVLNDGFSQQFIDLPGGLSVEQALQLADNVSCPTN
ncbi:hypothetical protein C8R47DRAFT_1138738 [Mycena vitilis]|nr:hypothetical protein C8R47DRAFT_1019773 [Mycena vitilis]KAJ6478544.1 hypothetical protein C8R47DRAFT_1138738 [Mycena vitilis]